MCPAILVSGGACLAWRKWFVHIQKLGYLVKKQVPLDRPDAKHVFFASTMDLLRPILTLRGRPAPLQRPSWRASMTLASCSFAPRLDAKQSVPRSSFNRIEAKLGVLESRLVWTMGLVWPT
eukprot:2618356-Pyramimonas_sp.AAC.1